MTTRNVIVVGVDGTEAGRAALGWAVDQAARTGAEVHAIAVWSFEVSAIPGVNDPFSAAQRAEKVLAEDVAAATGGRSDVTILPSAIEGSAIDTLVGAAADAALLVLGDHRHGRLFEALLGSVTTGCLRHANCPVVVVPTSAPAPLRHPASGSLEGARY
jgi:nucleotide-binding universal stress UspA family protein